MTWFVYILQCVDGTYYCGITKNVQRRLLEHNSTIYGAKYTRARRPVSLVVSIAVKDRASACKIEYFVKKLPCTKKVAFLLQQVE